MRIRRVEIRNFRKLRGPFVLSDIPDGMTVLYGDNEDGKSTLLLALRAALFVRHDTKDQKIIREFLPYGSEVRPEVTLDLDCAGRAVRLKKGFFQRPSCEIEGTHGTFSGSAAEEELARLLRFSSPKKASLDAQHQGPCGLLWLSQGESFLQTEASSSVVSDLQTALEAEVGTVLSGELGRKLLELYRQRHAEFFTAERGQPKKVLREAEEKVAQLAESLSLLRQKQKEAEAHVDELSEVREKVRQLDERLGVERKTLLSLEQSLAEWEPREQEVQQLSFQTATCKQTLDRAKEEVFRRQNARKEWQKANTEYDVLERTVEELKKTRLDLEKEWEQAEKEKQEKEKEWAARQQELVVLRKGIEKGRVQREYTQRQAILVEVEQFLSELSGLENELLQHRIEPKHCEELARLERMVQEKQTALHASATVLSFEKKGDIPVFVNGMEVVDAGPSQEWILTERTEVSFGTLGTFVIAPGRTSAAVLRGQLQEAEQALLSMLGSLGVTDVMSAKEEAEHRQKRLFRKRELEREMSLRCPKGVSVLKQERDKLAQKLDQFAKEEGADSQTICMEGTEDVLAQKEAVFRTLANELLPLSHSAESKRKSLDLLRERVSENQGKLSQQKMQKDSLGQDLEKENALSSDEKLQENLRETDRLWFEANARCELAKQVLLEADVPGLRARTERLREEVKGGESERNAHSQRDHELSLLLRIHGQEGLSEQISEKEAEWERAQTESKHLQRKAQAIDLLLRSFSRQDERAKQTYLEPLWRVCKPHLSVLFPSARLSLDNKTLHVLELSRNGIQEPFSGLSLGTREQIAVCVRLAFADLWAEQGQAPPILLDDALTFCDDNRFDLMLQMLKQASLKHQILFLTCHRRSFGGTGIHTIHLTKNERIPTPKIPPNPPQNSTPFH